MLCLKILDENNRTLMVARGEKEVNLVCAREYQEGDKLVLELSEKNGYVWLQLDDAVGRALLYVTDNVWYPVPFGEKRTNFSPKAFWGKMHLLSARMAKDYEIEAYRNLAYNPYDQHADGQYGNNPFCTDPVEKAHCYPHASANMETRGETVFAAKNAIDGLTANGCHGEWPYSSWGIELKGNPTFRLDFGRAVETDRLIVYLRADYPHDSWWEKAVVTFSDGSSLPLALEKSPYGQEFTFEKRTIEWLEVSGLVKAEDPSPFPALTQLEVYGR